MWTRGRLIMQYAEVPWPTPNQLVVVKETHATYRFGGTEQKIAVLKQKIPIIIKFFMQMTEAIKID